MATSPSRFNELMEKYLQARATSAELHELSWRLQSRLYEDELGQMIEDTWLAGETEHAKPGGINQREEIIRKILDEDREKLSSGKTVIRMRSYRWIAAACVLVAAGGVVPFSFLKKKNNKGPP